jgi:hypothetical protein
MIDSSHFPNLMFSGTAQSWAVMSPCGGYRYALGRLWDASLPICVWVCHNPSIATHEVNDPSQRKMCGFSQLAGCGGIVVVNVAGARATDPDELLVHKDPVGPYNGHVVQQMVNYDGASLVIAGWGRVHKKLAPLAMNAVAIATVCGRKLHCLGVNLDGSPRHPLYVPYTTKPLLLGDARDNLRRGFKNGLLPVSTCAVP